VSKLFDEVAGRFAGRQGGYTRLIKTVVGSGDTAAMVAIELVTKRDTAQSQSTKPSAEKGSLPAAKGPSESGAKASSSETAS